MNHDEAVSLDDVIAAYLQELDGGKPGDPEAFIAQWPNHRDDFLRFVGQTSRLKELTTDAIDDGSPVDPSAAGAWNLTSRVIGRFKLGPMIARGGMSRVYEATDLANGEPVALKLLDSTRVLDSSIQARFCREAEAVQSLEHPHIVPLLAYADHDGVPYLAFPLIHGCTLAQLVTAFRSQEDTGDSRPTVIDAAGGADDQAVASDDKTMPDVVVCREPAVSGKDVPVDVPSFALECFDASRIHDDRNKDVAELIANAADALHAAHGQGIVHRDVKPSNLMIDHNGQLWLTDFGLASIRDSQTVLTQTGQLVGTPDYMSPEQAGGNVKVVDHRSDLFSLGATLYQLATLQRPYHGDRFRVLMDISRGRLTAPSRVRGDIPKPLEAIILKAMSLEPADRYDSAADMAADLRRFAAGRHPRARAPGFTDKAIRWLVRNPRTSLSAAAGIMTAAILVFVLLYASGQQLSEVNSRLSVANTTLEQTNADLEETNADLDQSRNRLRRHLYVADMASAYRAYAQRDLDAVDKLLQRQVTSPGEGEGETVDQRGFEWWLLQNLTRPPEALELTRHQAAATEAAIVPGREELLSVGEDGCMHHWDLKAGREIKRWEIGGSLDAIAVSPDGNRVVVGSNIPQGLNPVTLRSVADGRVLENLQGHKYSMESAAFSPDGRWIATAGRYHEVLLHDAEGRMKGRLMTGSRNESLQFSPDSRQLLAVFRDTVDDQKGQWLRAWTVPDLQPAATWQLPFDPMVFGFSANGQRIAVANFDNWSVLRWQDQTPVDSRGEIRGRIRCLALDSEGSQLAVGCDNGLLHLVQLAAGQGDTEHTSARVIATGDRKITSIQFLDQQRIIVTSDDGSVQVWSTNQTAVQHPLFGESVRAISRRSIDADELFLRSDYGRIDRLSLSEMRLSPVGQLDPDEHFKLAATSDGQTIVATGVGTLSVFSAELGTRQRQIDTGMGTSPCSWLQFLDSDRRLLVLYSDRMLVYRTKDWTLTDRVVLTGSGANQLLVSPDQTTILVVAKGALSWYRADQLNLLTEYPRKASEFSFASYSDDGELIAVGHHDGTIELLRAADQTRVGLLQGHRDYVYDMCFIESDRTLVSCSQGQMIRFWDVGSGRELGQVQAAHNTAGFLHFSRPLQELFVFGPHGPIKVWSGERAE